MSLDAHGQPFNLRFNRARRAERDLTEFLGLAKGLLADGEISTSEAGAIAQWVVNHPDAIEQWPLNRLAERLGHIYADGQIDDEERADLADLLASIVGGTAGVILGEDAATDLPIDIPPPVFSWTGTVFVFTGKFAFGTRAECQRRVANLGGICESNITRRTDYVVIGTFGSRDWVHTSFGRKIQKAVEYRSTDGRPFIVAEDYWASCIDCD